MTETEKKRALKVTAKTDRGKTTTHASRAAAETYGAARLMAGESVEVVEANGAFIVRPKGIAKDIEPVGERKEDHPVPPEMHSSKLMEAVREKRPFSVRREGRLFGETHNAKDAQPDPHEDKRWKQHMHEDGLWCGDVNCKTCAKSGAMAKGVKEMKRAKDGTGDAEVKPVGEIDYTKTPHTLRVHPNFPNECSLCHKRPSNSLHKKAAKDAEVKCAGCGTSSKTLYEDAKAGPHGGQFWCAGCGGRPVKGGKVVKATDEVKPVKYNAEAVQKEINKDKRIGGKEAKAIHALLKGRTGDYAPSAELAKLREKVNANPKDKEVMQQFRDLEHKLQKLPGRAPRVKDASPFEVDTDAGAERIVKREAKAGLTAAQIARKHGFSLSFVKEVLGEVQPVGDKILWAAVDEEGSIFYGPADKEVVVTKMRAYKGPYKLHLERR